MSSPITHNAVWASVTTCQPSFRNRDMPAFMSPDISGFSEFPVGLLDVNDALWGQFPGATDCLPLGCTNGADPFSMRQLHHPVAVRLTLLHEIFAVLCHVLVFPVDAPAPTADCG